MAEKKKTNEFQLIRIYDAPVEAVWDAWTDPDQVVQWWGPRGFTLTTHAKDLRSGGFWKYTMHGPDGTDYENKTIYHEVIEHSKLVYDHGGSEDRPPLFRVTALFTEIEGKTKLEMTMSCPSPEAAEEMRKLIKKAGGEATWDRLDEFLQKERHDRDVFVINRSFDAPINVVFEMWTNPKHFVQWLPPTGATMEFLRADVRPGGSLFYCMTAGATKMYGTVEYLDIKDPHQLVYTQQFSDEKGGVSRHPMAPTWPETMLTKVQLAAEGPDRTRVTVTWQPHGSLSPEELETFIKGRAGMTQGWTGSFDKLEALLARS